MAGFKASLVFAIAIAASTGVLVDSLTLTGPGPAVQENEEIAFQKLKGLEKKLVGGVEQIIRKALPMLVRYSSEVELSDGCMSSLLKTVYGLRNLEMWAVQMIESFGIPGGGIISGTASALGNYQQCTNVVFPEVRLNNKDRTVGQYCLIKIRPPLPPRPKKIKFLQNVFKQINATFDTELFNQLKVLFFNMYEAPYKMAVCLPSACTQQDVSNILQPISEEIEVYTEVESCEVKNSARIDTFQLAILMFLVVIVLVNICASFLDEFVRYRSKNLVEKPRKIPFLELSFPQQVIQSFSVRRNFESLIAIRLPEKKSLDCMKGIKYFSVTWIVLGHSYLLYDRTLSREAIRSRVIIEDLMSQVISSSMLSIESFMFVSSTLVAYTLVTLWDFKKIYSPVTFFFRRAIRVAPSILLMSSFIILVPLMGSGPHFREPMKHYANMCREKWWTNIIFVGNFVKYDQMCLANAWYYSADFQCLVLALAYLFILFKCKKFGYSFLAFLLVGAVFSTGLLTYIFEYPPAFLAVFVDDRYFNNYVNGVYFLPNVHFGVYAAGLFLGTYIARNPKIVLPKWSVILGWTCALSAGLVAVYGLYPWNGGKAFTVTESVIYSSAQRTLWGLCLAWVVLACYTGNGGVANYLMSMPIFQPLLRLSNLIYLVHTLLIIYTNHTRQGLTDSTHVERVFQFLGILTSSHIVAFLLRIIFESPIIQLEKACYKFLSGLTRKKEDHNSSSNATFDVKKWSTNVSYI